MGDLRIGARRGTNTQTLRYGLLVYWFTASLVYSAGLFESFTKLVRGNVELEHEMRLLVLP